MISGSVAGRRAAFVTARVCAHRALSTLGHEPRPVLPGVHNQPIRPDGVVGAITHCTGYRAAAAAGQDEWLSLGIDAEPHAYLPDGLRTWFPLVRASLDFTDIEIRIDPDINFLSTTMRVLALTGHYEGRWSVKRGALMTAVALPAHALVTTVSGYSL
ncbi:4'-phosphopantetheinyl transferase [Streptomyces leeuwenhoekii]|uniref:4'-phosphopantetheinyl transferase family protein n=1 Tax=Streptomyces leeuwenhoekii TaxID=1437453 RepID=UPI00369DF5E1